MDTPITIRVHALETTIENNHKEANKTGIIARKNQRRLDELVGQRGDAGIIADIAEIKDDIKEIKNRDKRSSLAQWGGAAGGASIVVGLIELAKVVF